jgi:hypothetical protein
LKKTAAYISAAAGEKGMSASSIPSAVSSRIKIAPSERAGSVGQRAGEGSSPPWELMYDAMPDRIMRGECQQHDINVKPLAGSKTS